MNQTRKKVVLAYSGGLDTTVILHWLANKGFEVIALCVDLGQPQEEYSELKKKALNSGASEVLVLDAKQEFVEDYIIPCLMMNSYYEGSYLLGTSIARPLIAKKMIETAKEYNAEYVAHGATGKGNDQARFEIGFFSLNPEIKVISPWKMPEFFELYPGRQELIKYAAEHNLPVKTTAEKPWSCDENMMHISYEGGLLEDAWQKPLDDMFIWTKSPQQAPDKTTSLIIEFKDGVPCSLDGQNLSPLVLYTKLNEIAAKNAVGRIDLVESRFIGMKSRGVYETPAGTLLIQAHRQIESITLTYDVIELKDILMPRFASLVYKGFWFTPQMKLMRDLARQSQIGVSGEVRLELYKGNVTITGRRSENSIYNADIASMEKDEGNFNPTDSAGFIKLNSLPFMLDKKRGK